ncbi:O-methyltransferase [Actinoplanes sp. NPDC051859]|uniref:O-methyltransferase n=1 Tax=Actinoplanes sp. NPDC051859 TaxID=3363909 RepID=UPI00378BF94F
MSAARLVDQPWRRPPQLDALLTEANRLGFAMSCEDRTGALLAVLAASKPGGRLLELGTGAGAGAAWLLDGMTATATLMSVEADPTVQDVARRHLGMDPRLRLVQQDAAAWLAGYTGPMFDLAYVDCRPGKYEHLDRLVSLLRPGALYVGDDLSPQPTWPHDHQGRVDAFLDRLVHERGIRPLIMNWASGLVVAART